MNCKFKSQTVNDHQAKGKQTKITAMQLYVWLQSYPNQIPKTNRENFKRSWAGGNPLIT